MKKIAIIGAPGSGKTTLAHGLSYMLKINKHHVEYVPELIKYKFFQEKDFNEPGFDTSNTLEQMNLENVFKTKTSKNEIDFLICEAPLCNGFFYSVFYNKELEAPILKKIAKDHINSYDIILILKKIPGNDYISFGRKEDEMASQKFEDSLIDSFKQLNYNGITIEVNQKTDIEDLIKTILVFFS